MVYSVFTFIIVLCCHLLIITHLTEAVELENNDAEMYELWRYENDPLLEDLRTEEQ